MLHRALASLLCLLGAAAAALGIASATVWRASDTLVASATTVDGATYLATEPGVLDLAADEVTVRATAASGPVVIALGTTADVQAWLGTDPQTWVTGLVDLTTLSTRDGAASDEVTTPSTTPSATPSESAAATEAPTDAATAAPTDAAATAPADAGAEDGTTPAVTLVDPTGSDLWTEQVTGEREATLTWTRQDGRWSVLVAATGGVPVTIELTWPQVVTTPWLVPGVVVGAVLLVVGLVWWLLLVLAARRRLPLWLVHSRLGNLLRQLRPRESDAAPRRTGSGPAVVVAEAESAPDLAVRVPPAIAPQGPPVVVPGRRAAPEASSTSQTERPPSAGVPSAPAAQGGSTPSAMTRRELRALRERLEREERGEPEPLSAGQAAGAHEPAAPSAAPSATQPAAQPAMQPAASPASRPTGSPASAAPVISWTPVTPSASRAGVGVPTPSPTGEPERPRGLLGRLRTGRPSRTVAPPPAVDEPQVVTPAPAPPATSTAASADAWRKAWGLPSAGGDEPPAPTVNDSSEVDR